MKKVFFIILISCFSLTITSCSEEKEEYSATVTTTTDTTAPTANVTTDTITNSSNAVVQSTETGTAYLVKTTVSVSNLASIITGAADSQWRTVLPSVRPLPTPTWRPQDLRTVPTKFMQWTQQETSQASPLTV